jgi:predicted amidohydrolase YtcJ
MTHEYTLLLGATILPGGDAEPCEALAWALGIVLAVGPDAAVRAISRGDSHVIACPGAFVVPLEGQLEAGARADLAVYAADPRGADSAQPIAVIRGGHVVAGALSGA